MDVADTELHDFTGESAPSLPHYSTSTKARVMVATALLQLPVWGFMMSYGIFQKFYSTAQNLHLQGSISATGAIGTTSNGIVYCSMPFLFAMFSQRWLRLRHAVAYGGLIIASISYLLSSYSTQVWQVVVTQGVFAAIGSALMFVPPTLLLGETFKTSGRTLAYGISLSSKNIIGSTCPFLLQFLLDRYGFAITMRIWAAIVAGSGIGALLLFPIPSQDVNSPRTRLRQTPWHFLKHKTFWVYAGAIVLQTSGYGIPQSFLPGYGSGPGHLSETSSTLLLTLFNIPGIVSSSAFAYLTENKHFTLSASATSAISSFGAALAVFTLWGIATPTDASLLALTMLFGFFSSGYSSIWGGMLKLMEREAAERNEAIDSGVVYGLFNGARGIGYLGGGFISVELLKNGRAIGSSMSGFGTEYGSLIIFTGIATFMGGWSVFWRCKNIT